MTRHDMMTNEYAALGGLVVQGRAMRRIQTVM
jgi:hypothetical protein